MSRERWLKLPLVVRMLLVVGGLLLIFGLLSRFLPPAIDFVLALAVLVLGLAYTGWEWGLIKRRKADLEAHLRRERHNWQQGLPAHLRTPEQNAPPDLPVTGEQQPPPPGAGSSS